MEQAERNEKARFMACYFGQEVMMYNDSDGDPFWSKQIYPVDAKNLQVDLSLMHLVLKPLKTIPDEDAIAVSRMDVSIDKETHKFINPPGNRQKEIDYGKNNIYFLCDKTKIADYLRSKSYALPWMGISVEEQISRGWIKLINK